MWYIEALDGWSILAACAGAAWLLGGWPLLRWTGPAILFLFFMIPLPFRIEHLLTLPLQRIATVVSCSILQCLGQPDLSEGNTIWLGEHHLQVEEACAGLRIFMGVIALAAACAMLGRGSRLDKALLLVAVIPIALFANALRIVGTGLLYQYVSGDVGRQFSHGAAGWVMILLCTALLSLVAWYWRQLVPEVRLANVRQLVHAQRNKELQRSVSGRSSGNE
jgi:exosortase